MSKRGKATRKVKAPRPARPAAPGAASPDQRTASEPARRGRAAWLGIAVAAVALVAAASAHGDSPPTGSLRNRLRPSRPRPSPQSTWAPPPALSATSRSMRRGRVPSTGALCRSRTKRPMSALPAMRRERESMHACCTSWSPRTTTSLGSRASSPWMPLRDGEPGRLDDRRDGAGCPDNCGPSGITHTLCRIPRRPID